MAIEISNLDEFRRDLRRAADATPRELTKALKLAGTPALERAAELTPRRTGSLARSYGTSVRGSTASIVNRQPYAGGSEWGIHRKWSGFDRYGPAGSRFAGRAVDERGDEIADLVTEGLRDIIELHGWATEEG